MTLFVPSRVLIECDHPTVREQRMGGRCEKCNQKVFLTPVEFRWMTMQEQSEWRESKRGITHQ